MCCSLKQFLQRLRKRDIGPLLYRRDTQETVHERIPFKSWLENEIMYSRPLDIIDRTQFIRRALKTESFDSEHENHTYISATKIPGFIDFHEIDMSDFVYEKPSDYVNFNKFFIRELKPGKRPIPETDEPCITSAADCRLSLFNDLNETKSLLIKGKKFSLERLVNNDSDLQSLFKDGSVANFRLAPQDYHRFHSCISGTVVKIYQIDGTTFTTEPKALRSDIDILGENERTIIHIQDQVNNIDMLYVPIGAEAVGKVNVSIQEGDTVNQGDCIGYFDYGGSDILVMFTPKVLWDDDIRDQTKKGIETIVKANEHIGSRTA